MNGMIPVSNEHRCGGDPGRPAGAPGSPFLGGAGGDAQQVAHDHGWEFSGGGDHGGVAGGPDRKSVVGAHFSQGVGMTWAARWSAGKQVGGSVCSWSDHRLDGVGGDEPVDQASQGRWKQDGVAVDGEVGAGVVAVDSVGGELDDEDQGQGTKPDQCSRDSCCQRDGFVGQATV
ncbi:hypothetical protein ABZV91_13040 [Nocardia sp. NPDC004568]|uniref:hypothetical protein n=1 Tax=Nocardia sp. NPDC004568 TaxID=3154551 RepID=UPI00339E74D9